MEPSYASALMLWFYYSLREMMIKAHPPPSLQKELLLPLVVTAKKVAGETPKNRGVPAKLDTYLLALTPVAEVSVFVW